MANDTAKTVKGIPVFLLKVLFNEERITKAPVSNTDQSIQEEDIQLDRKGGFGVFAPILIPIVLIALKSIANYPSFPLGEGVLFELTDFIGNPVIALLIGVFLAFLQGRSQPDRDSFKWTTDALKEAGLIILITGAGGAFGAILKAMDLAQFLNFSSNSANGGLLIAFGFAAILKTAQGSSTVAIVTASAFMVPLLDAFGLDYDMGKTFTVLAIGAGAMTLSHLNDSYFWVVSQFSDMEVKSALRHYSLTTLIQGILGLLIVLVLFQLAG